MGRKVGAKMGMLGEKLGTHFQHSLEQIAIYSIYAMYDAETAARCSSFSFVCIIVISHFYLQDGLPYATGA